MSTSEPYALQPLLYPALPAEAGVNAKSPAALGRSLRCAEPFGAHLYLGTSDGKVHCYEQRLATQRGVNGSPSPPSTDRQHGQWEGMEHVGTRVVSAKAIERILIMPGISVAAVCSEATLSFYALPAFEAIPQQVLPHIKGVAAIALDDAERRRDDEGLSALCVIRRKGIMLVRMSIDTWRVVKEIPLPRGATGARRFGKWLCISTTSDYSVVDLDEATISSVGLPISQTSEAPSASSRPSIVAIETSESSGKCEFLITSHSEDLTLGVFVSQEGEPTSKLIEWPSHPRALSLDFPHLHALLRNDTIEIHNVITLVKKQTVYLPPLLEPRTLSAGSSLLRLSDSESASGLAINRVSLENGALKISNDDAQDNRQQSDRDVVVSRILLTGKNAVQCLAPNRVVATIIKALKRQDYYHARDLFQTVTVDDAHGNGSSSHTLDTRQLNYIAQCIGIESLLRLRFEEAADQLQRGAFPLDLFVVLFPRLSASLRPEKSELDAFTDVVAAMKDLGNLEEFPALNVASNYFPPLDMSSEEVTILHSAMKKHLERFCKSMLGYYRGSNGATGRARLVDTMLARVLITERDRDSVSALLSDDSSQCDQDLIEEGLESVGCYAALARLARARGDIAKTLDLQSRLLEGSLEDPAFDGNLQDFANLVTLCDDPELSHRFGVWLVQRDVSAGVKILTKGKGQFLQNEVATFDELRKVDPVASIAFLEAVALSRKAQDAEMQQKLFVELVSQIKTAFDDAQEKDLANTVTSDFAAGTYAESFLAHLSLRMHESKSVIPRLKLMMLLQGSNLLTASDALAAVEQISELQYERAILLGKLDRDEEALKILAIELRDANSSETYCSQARRPISAVLAHNLDSPQLKVYVSFLQRSLKRKAAHANVNNMRDQPASTDKISLIKKLLWVYMQKDDASNTFQIATSHLLNTQAMHLPATEVLETVPAHWSAHTLETFLSRSLRRELHHANEGHIQRAMALSQNLETAQDLWSQRRAMGGIIDEGSEDSHDVGYISAHHEGTISGEKEDIVPPDVAEDVITSLAEKAIQQEQQLLRGRHTSF